MTWVRAPATSPGCSRSGGRTRAYYSNAALHWLGAHDRLFPALLSALAPGGVLAVQMPRNFSAPSHTAISEAARSGPWRPKLEPLLRSAPVAEPAFYVDLLTPRAAALDIWETEYLQALEGDHPVPQPLEAPNNAPQEVSVAVVPVRDDGVTEQGDSERRAIRHQRSAFGIGISIVNILVISSL